MKNQPVQNECKFFGSLNVEAPFKDDDEDK